MDVVEVVRGQGQAFVGCIVEHTLIEKATNKTCFYCTFRSLVVLVSSIQDADDLCRSVVSLSLFSFRANYSFYFCISDPLYSVRSYLSNNKTTM